MQLFKQLNRLKNYSHLTSKIYMSNNNSITFSDNFTSFLLIKFLKGFSVKNTKNLLDQINVPVNKNSVATPLKYRRECKALYLTFGNFDVLTINSVPYLYNHTLPTNKGNLDDKAITSCNYAGLTFDHDPQFVNFDNEYPFVAFTQVKLNSYYFFSNPELFLGLIYQKIKSICEDDNHSKVIINYSFSSYELSICQFNDSLTKMEKAVREIRSLVIDIEDPNNVSLCDFYNQLDGTINCSTKRHFISDTLTHYGVKIIKENDEYNYINFGKYLENDHDDVCFYLDLKVKPGQVPQLIKGLNSGAYVALQQCIENSHRFTSGRLDLELEEIPAKDFYKAFIDLKKIKENGGDLRNCIRDIQTKIAFIHKNEMKDYSKFSNGTYGHIKKLKIEGPVIQYILDEILQDSSYDMVTKVNKMMTYYNNAIHNPLTFNLYIEFYNFIKYFIYTYGESDIKNNLEMLDAFDKAHNVRHFHESFSDEGTELLLGTNIPVQGLISDVNILFSIVYFELFNFVVSLSKADKKHFEEYLDDMCKSNHWYNPMPQIVYIHDSTPYASGISANFNISSVFNPELFFNYLIKEATVTFFSVEKTSKKDRNISLLFGDFYTSYFKEVVKEVAKMKLDNDHPIKIAFNKLDPSYFIEDMIRFVVLFDCKYDHYLRFHAISIYQASQEMESKDVLLNERLYSEIMRWLFIWQVYLLIENVDFNESDIRFQVKKALVDFYNDPGEDRKEDIIVIEKNIDAFGTLWNFWNSFCNQKGCEEQKEKISKLKIRWEDHINKSAKKCLFDLLKAHILDFCKNAADSNNIIKPNPKGGFDFDQTEEIRKRYSNNSTDTISKLSSIVYNYRKEFILSMQ